MAEQLLSHQGYVQEHLESAFEHWVTSLPTSHCPCGNLGSTTVIQMQTHPASSPANPLIWHCRFGIPEFPLHTCAGISTAIPSTWNSTLGHLVCCPHPTCLLALLAPPAAITMAGMTQTRQHPTRRSCLSTASHPSTATRAALPRHGSDTQGDAQMQHAVSQS